MLIAICGKSGSGKSTLASRLEEYYRGKAMHLNIDEIGHRVLDIAEVQKELEKAFSKDIIKDEKVSRKKLGFLVFNSREKMKKLTDITWKYMQSEIDDILEQKKDKVIILDWLLLPITKYLKLCDIKILLDVPYEIRKKRACERDNITEEAFDLREKASIDYKKEDFDICLKDTDELDLERLLEKL